MIGAHEEKKSARKSDFLYLKANCHAHHGNHSLFPISQQ